MQLVASKQSIPEPIPSSATQMTEFMISTFENTSDLEEVKVDMLKSRITVQRVLEKPDDWENRKVINWNGMTSRISVVWEEKA